MAARARKAAFKMNTRDAWRLWRAIESSRYTLGRRTCDFFALLFLTGMKICELREARWSYVHLDSDAPTIRVYGKRSKGHRKSHEIYLHPPAVQILRSMASREAGRLVFPGRDRGSRRERATISERRHAWKAVCKRAGLDPEKVKQRHLSEIRTLKFEGLLKTDLLTILNGASAPTVYGT